MPFTVELAEKPTVDEVRSVLLGAGEYLHGLQRKAPADRGDGYQADVRSAIDAIHNHDAILTAMERSMAPAPAPAGTSAATAVLDQQTRTLGEMVTQAAEYDELTRNHGGTSRHASIEVRGSMFANNDMYRTTITSGTTSNDSGSLLPKGSPVLPPPRQRRLFLRDLISVQQTGLAAIPYIREYTPATTEIGASSVAEGLAKPEVAMLWDPDTALVCKIAAWVPVTNEIIEDVATLRGYIDTRLAYMLAIREEQQILNGSGTSPQLKGILNFSGIQSQTFVSGDPMATLGRAIGKIELVDGDVDGIAMNPTDFWTMATTRFANQFDNGFGSGVPWGSPPQNPWGVPTVRSRAITAGTALVGAYAMAATLFDREQVTVRVGNQHSDFFTTNKVAILAEERVALAVLRPDLFCLAAVA